MPFPSPICRVLGLGAAVIALSSCTTSTSAATDHRVASGSAPASEDVAAPLAFTLVSESGEASRDAHSTTTTWVVQGTHITRTESSSGREARLGMPENPGSAEASADATSEGFLRKAAYDVARRVPADQPAPKRVDVTYRSICLGIDGHQHCAWQIGNDAPDDAYRALDSLETTLSGEVLSPE